MITPKKSLGQNFLRDKNIIQKIVRSLHVAHDALVIEIGPGEGALTEELVQKFTALQVVEIDHRAVAHLEQRFPGLPIHHKDILKVSWHDIIPKGQKAAVIGNLPYYITSPILFSVLDQGNLFYEAVFMMQKEVADRIVAPSGSKTYGILSVQSQILSSCEILFPVSRHVFDPKPKVESAVVKFTPRTLPDDFDLQHFKKVVRTAFNQRRKKLSNALKPVCDMERVPPQFLDKRAEQLSPEDFVIITNATKTIDLQS